MSYDRNRMANHVGVERSCAGMAVLPIAHKRYIYKRWRQRGRRKVMHGIDLYREEMMMIISEEGGDKFTLKTAHHI